MKKIESLSIVTDLARLAAQLTKFGTVGVAATLAHVGSFALGIELLNLPPLVSNLFAFYVAFVVSFIGHFYWTFRGQTKVPQGSFRLPWAAFFRFAAVAVTGLALNSAAVFFVVNLFHLPYGYACALMVTAVPFCTFILSKYWAFS